VGVMLRVTVAGVTGAIRQKTQNGTRPATTRGFMALKRTIKTGDRPATTRGRSVAQMDIERIGSRA